METEVGVSLFATTYPDVDFALPRAAQSMETSVPHESVTRQAAARLSILGALAYADLFDAPLTVEELAVFQVGTSFTLEEIKQRLRSDPTLAAATEQRGDSYCLAGRAELFDVKQKRKAACARLWRSALRYDKVLSRLPFVRMLAVTGSLAVDNVSARPDIDLMVVAAPGRVWICRRLLILAVRAARLFGSEICPNYVISAERLTLGQQDFFTAHELVQMVPLCGSDIYSELMGRNAWTRDYLPGAFTEGRTPKEAVGTTGKPGFVRATVERVLRSRVFDRWERWEMQRLCAKLSNSGTAASVTEGSKQDSEVVCSPEECKGHTAHHKHATMARYRDKLCELGLIGALDPLLGFCAD